MMRFVASLLLLGTAIVALAQTPLNEWTKRLDSAHGWALVDRVAKVREVASDKAPESLPLLIGALSDPSPDVWHPAVLALGRRRSPETFQMIVDLVPTQINKGAWESAYELFRYQYEFSRELFYRNWDNRSPGIRGVLTCGLGMHVRREEFWRLVSRLADSAGNVVWEAVYGLHRYQAPEYQRALVGLLSHPDRHVRSGAIQTLGLQNSQIARWPIFRRLNDADPEIRRVAGDALNRIDSAQPKR